MVGLVRIKRRLQRFSTEIERKEAIHETLWTTFHKCDKNHDGFLTIDELKDALQSLKYSSSISDIGRDEAEELLAKVVHENKTQAHYKLNFDQFCTLFDASRLREIFETIDINHTGHISRHEIYGIMQSYGYKISYAHADLIVNTIDKDGNGTVEFDEFVHFFKFLPNVNMKKVIEACLQLSQVDFGSDLGTPLPPANVDPTPYVVAGGLGGIFSRTMLAPLERVRLIAQTFGISSIKTQLLDIYVAEGAKGLWLGNLIGCLRIFPFTGIVCYVYNYLNESFKKNVPNATNKNVMIPLYTGISGGAAGTAATLFTYPIDLMRAKVTLQDEQRKGFWKIARDTFEKSGLKGFYRGILPTVLSVAPFVAIQQSSYSFYKDYVLHRLEVEPSFQMYLFLGICGGTTATCITYPLDLLRRQMQVDIIPQENVVKGLAHVVKHGNARSLYNGISPTLLKVAPSVAISVSIRDFVLENWSGSLKESFRQYQSLRLIKKKEKEEKIIQARERTITEQKRLVQIKVFQEKNKDKDKD